MRVRCLHGFFLFQETTAGQVSDFASATGLKLEPFGSDYTFEALALAPSHSIQGKPLLGLPAVATYQGQPWEVFEANQFVFDFDAGIMKPITSVILRTWIRPAGNYFVSPGLIMPGSIADQGRVKSYDGRWLRGRWVYSGVEYV